MESIGARCHSVVVRNPRIETRSTNSELVLFLQELATVTYERKKKSQVAARRITLHFIWVWRDMSRNTSCMLL